jgi:hypothetical protein
VIDEDSPLPCLSCGGAVLPVLGKPEVDGATFDTSIEGTGDPPMYRNIEIAVCGECITEAGRKGRVILRVTPELESEISLWTA